MKFIFLIVLFITISYYKYNNNTNKLKKKILNINSYLKKGGILDNNSKINTEIILEEDNTNINNIYYKDLGESGIKHRNIKSSMNSTLKDIDNSLDNDMMELELTGGSSIIDKYRNELDTLKNKNTFNSNVLKEVTSYSNNTISDISNKSYNNIVNENNDILGNVYNNLKDNNKYLDMYADELGINVDDLKKELTKINKEIDKENNSDNDNADKNNSGIINKVTTFVKSSIDNIFGTNLLELNNNNINSTNEKKNIDITEKNYDNMINIYENKINKELTNKGNIINKRDTDTNYRTNKLEGLNISDIQTENINKFSENDKNNSNNRQIDLQELYSNNKIISPSENLCSDGLELNKKRYDKYNDLVLDINNINKIKKKDNKILEPYNMDEFEEYSCLDVNCDNYKDKHSRVNSIN
jgi:hypothetical protein